MSQRADPERIRQARREALRNRLIGNDHLLPQQADRWIAAWVKKVGEPESAAEFDAAYEWVVSEIAGGVRR